MLAEVIERRIYLIRGHKVMLGNTLADLYEAATKALNLVCRKLLAAPDPPKRRIGYSVPMDK